MHQNVRHAYFVAQARQDRLVNDSIEKVDNFLLF